MPENQNTQVDVALETALTNALNIARENFPLMQEKAARAKIALSAITVVGTKEEDEKANLYLVKTKKTYDEISEMRKAITTPLDTIKALLMEPEKVVSLEASHTAVSAAWPIKLLRNDFATKEAIRIANENKAIESEKNKKEEIARLKAVFTNRFHEAISEKVKALRISVSDYFNGIKLDGWDKSVARFNMKPTLKQADFESWFIVEWDKTKLPAADFESLLSDIKSQFTFEEVNKIYVSQAEPIVDEYKAKLPALKSELEQTAEIAKTNAEEAQRLENERIEASKKSVATANAELDKEVKEQTEAVNREADNEILNAEFEGQIASQAVGEQSGVRKTKVAKITAPHAQTVAVLAKVLFACFTNPEFEGLYARDKTTRAIKADADGNPEFAKWAEPIMDFWANHCSDAKIDGVETYERVTAVTKK